MKHAVIAGSFLFFVALSGCGKATDEELMKRGFDNQRIDKIDDAMAAFDEMLQTYPKSPKVPEALYAMGGLYQNNKHDFKKAIDSYRRVVAEYGDHPTASSAAFLVGFIYNNELKDTASARAAYGEFLKKYPASPMVTSALFELEHLGKDPSQILQEAAPVASAQKKAPAPKKR